MKRIAITIFLFSTLSSFAQNVTKEELETAIKPLNEKITSLQTENGNRKKEIKNLQAKLADDSIKIDSLQKQTESNGNAITQTSTDLSGKITQTGKASEEKISAVDQSLSKTSLYGIIGVLLAILLSGLLYFLLSKRQKTDKTDVEQQIQNTKKSLLDEGAKLDTQLAEILERQLKLIQEERNVNGTKDESEIDHSMPLKVADEITRINAYANTLDPNSQDAKALKSSVKRLTNTFKAANYDIIDLLGQKYDDGLKVQVINTVPDEKLKAGEEFITRIIKPLVKYKGVQIQAAQVDTSFGQ